MTRLAPFDYAFADLAAEHFAAIREEAALLHKDTSDRAQFFALPTVQRVLAAIEAPDVLTEAPEAGPEYATLLYAAYRYWLGGQHLIAITAPDAATSTADMPLSVPHGACYLQLPERRYWSQIAEGEPHEPLDGMFVAAGSDGREITVVAVLGLRADRGGFSEVSVTATPVEFAAAATELRSPAFAPLMEGGDRAGFKSVATTAELLHLTRLALGTGHR